MVAPITLLYAGVLGLMMAALSIQVPIRRGLKDIPWGDGGDPQLATSIRVFGNFIEYVPAALVLFFLLETSGAERWVLHALGVTLVVARVVHAGSLKSGTELSSARKAGRGLGAMATWAVILVSAGYALSLAADGA